MIEKIIKHKFIALIAVLVVIVIIGFLSLGKAPTAQYQTAKAIKADVIQDISVTGTVKPKDSVDLSFEVGGKVSGVFASVGDEVKQGQKLISLNSADINAQLAQAGANLETAKAREQQFEAALNVEKNNLADMQSGTRPEEIQIAQTTVNNAQKALNDANTNLSNVQAKAVIDLSSVYSDAINTLDESYTKADDALNKQIIDLFSENTPNNFKLTFSVQDQSLKYEVEQKRVASESEVKSLSSEINNLISSSYVEDELPKARAHLAVVRDFLSRLSDVLDGSVGLTPTTLSTYKGYVNTARTNINTEISNIDTSAQAIASQNIINQNSIFAAQSSVNDAESALASANDTLTLKKAGATQDQIRAQENRVVQAEANVAEQQAQIKQAQASIENYQAQLQKTIIYSPIDGTLTKLDPKVGEVVTPGVIAASVIDRSRYDIEVYIPETDIAKAELEDPATVTLDAYGSGIVFDAKLIKIDPAETVIEGVSTYKSTLSFADPSEKIKSGMTANVDITAGVSKNVISIPQRAVIDKNGKKIVRVLDGKNLKEVEVEIGLKGSDGTIEIKSGIQEGQDVVVFIQ